MDLFDFDHDDHPSLRTRSISVDSVNAAELQVEQHLAGLRLNGSCSSSTPAATNNILSPRPTTNGALATILEANNKTSPVASPHLAAFYYQEDKDRAMTPERSFLAAFSSNNNNNSNPRTAANKSQLNQETNPEEDESINKATLAEENDEIEYEVKIDDFVEKTTTGGSGTKGSNGNLLSDLVRTDSNESLLGSTTNGTQSPIPGMRRPRHKMSPADFTLLKVIGRGAYGKVYLVRHVATNNLYAMKVLKKASIIVHAKDTACTMSERKILEAIRHPFIVKLHFAFQTNHRLYLILEYASGGELFTHLAAERMFSEENTAYYAAQLVLALEHLHSLGIIYRDLKPENIMLNARGDIMLTDFGLSKVPLEHSDGRTGTVCGTIEYMAPEVVCEKVQYDRTVDWWSLGIVIHDMLTGSPPFVSNNRKKTMDAIMNKKLNLPYYLSMDAKDLLTKLLKRNPSVRLGSGPDGIANIKKHRFFRKIDWKLLEQSELDPPISPYLSDPESTENFDAQFTSLAVEESPIDTTHVTSLMFMGDDGSNGNNFHNGLMPPVLGFSSSKSSSSAASSGYSTPRPMVHNNGSATTVLTANGLGMALGMMTEVATGDEEHDVYSSGAKGVSNVTNGIPMAKTRSSSPPDHHHFEDFSYVSKSHLVSHGFLE